MSDLPDGVWCMLDASALLAKHPAYPTLRDLRRIARFAGAADEAARLHGVQQALIHRRRWTSMLAPAACGGAELPLPDAVRIEEAIAAADGSTGWLVTLCAGAGWFAGFLPPALARTVMDTRRVCLAGSGAASGFADTDGDGYRISGSWDYASGATMATHFTLNAVLRAHGTVLCDASGAPLIRAFIVPAAGVELVPSWRTIGMRATSSHSYRIDAVRVPSTHCFEISAAGATAPGPLYRFPFLALAYATLAANLSGMAVHFCTLARDSIGKRRMSMLATPLSERPDVAAFVAQAEAELMAARAHFYGELDAAWARVAGDAPAADSNAVPLEQAAMALVRAARQAVDGLYPYCGLRAAQPANAINRVWRDFHTATQHALLLP